MADYRFARVPEGGDVIQSRQGRLVVPCDPIIPCIEGDGTGCDIWRATGHVSEAAVARAYGGQLSHAAVRIGGLGLAPGANVGDEEAVYEATHGTAPEYADVDRINPGSLILSGVMTLERLGRDEAAALVVRGLAGAVRNQNVTCDLERQMEGATLVSTSRFGEEIVRNMA